MGTNAKMKEDAPPDSNDLQSWRCVIAEGRHSTYSKETLVAALQDLGPRADMQVRNALAGVLSDDAVKRLRRKVGYNHPNEGWDIIWRTHEYLFNAIGRPRSADGKGFREAYIPRLMYRLKDAIAKEMRERRTEDDIVAEKAIKAGNEAKPQKLKLQPDDREKGEAGDEDDLADLEASQSFCQKVASASDDDEAAPSKTYYHPELFEEVNAMLEQIDVDRLLKKCVPDEKKRLAFRLFIDQIPYKTKRKESTHSIADALGIDESTARNWIEEVKDILKAKVGAEYV